MTSSQTLFSPRPTRWDQNRTSRTLSPLMGLRSWAALGRTLVSLVMLYLSHCTHYNCLMLHPSLPVSCTVCLLVYWSLRMNLCVYRCTIDWTKGKNVTLKTIKKKQKHKGRGTVRTVTKTVPNDSFFNFFSPPEGINTSTHATCCLTAEQSNIPAHGKFNLSLTLSRLSHDGLCLECCLLHKCLLDHTAHACLVYYILWSACLLLQS